MFHSTTNSLVQTKPAYDRSHSYPLTLHSLTKPSTISRVSPASSSPTATHAIPKSIPGSPSLLSTTTLPSPLIPCDANLAEIMATSTHIHIYSLPLLEESLRKEWRERGLVAKYISLTYDKSLDFKVILQHIDGLDFRPSLRLWTISCHIFIKMSSTVHDMCTSQFGKIVEDALRNVANCLGGTDHDLFRTSTSLVRVPSGSKQPDNGWRPCAAPHDHGPWVVVETGFSETAKGLAADAKWWIKHGYCLKCIVLIDIRSTKTKSVDQVTDITIEFILNITDRISIRQGAVGKEGEDRDGDNAAGIETKKEGKDGDGDNEDKEDDKHREDDDKGCHEKRLEEKQGKKAYKTVEFYTLPGEGPVTKDLLLHVSWFYGFNDGRPDWLPPDFDSFIVPASQLEALRDLVVKEHATWSAGVYQPPEPEKRTANDHGIYYENDVDPMHQRTFELEEFEIPNPRPAKRVKVAAEVVKSSLPAKDSPRVKSGRRN